MLITLGGFVTCVPRGGTGTIRAEGGILAALGIVIILLGWIAAEIGPR
jgi:hypothetical protein